MTLFTIRRKLVVAVSVIYFIQLAHPLFQVSEEPLATAGVALSSHHVKTKMNKCKRQLRKAWEFPSHGSSSVPWSTLHTNRLRALVLKMKTSSFRLQSLPVCSEMSKWRAGTMKTQSWLVFSK
jgi:hypothetical protein